MGDGYGLEQQPVDHLDDTDYHTPGHYKPYPELVMRSNVWTCSHRARGLFPVPPRGSSHRRWTRMYRDTTAETANACLLPRTSVPLQA